MDEIRGIKPVFEVGEYLFILYIVIGVVVFLFVSYYLYKKLFNKEDKRKHYIQLLQSIDLGDTKDASYKITQYGREIIPTEKENEIFLTLQERLEKYKYKSKVPKEFDKETLELYYAFLETIDG